MWDMVLIMGIWVMGSIYGVKGLIFMGLYSGCNLSNYSYICVLQNYGGSEFLRRTEPEYTLEV